MKINKSERANPMLSFVLEDTEYRALNKIAELHGVSIAQVARGFLRLGISFSKQSMVTFDKSHEDFVKQVEVIRIGSFNGNGQA